MTATGISSAEDILGCVRRDAGLMYRILCGRGGLGFAGEVGEGGRRTCGISYSGKQSGDLRRLLEVKRLVGDNGPVVSNVNTRVMEWLLLHTCWLPKIG